MKYPNDEILEGETILIRAVVLRMHFMVILIKVNLDVLKLLKFVLFFCMTSLVTFFDSRMVTLNLSHTHTHTHRFLFTF